MRLSKKTLIAISLSVAFFITSGLALMGLPPNTVLAGTPTCTWTGAGADTNWSTAANWTCDAGTVPVDGTTLVFPQSASNFAPHNDLVATNVYSGIKFNGTGANAYTIDGNGLILAGDIDDNATYNRPVDYYSSAVTIKNDISLESDVIMNISGFSLNGNLSLATFNLSINGGTVYNYVALGGTLTGSGSITTTGDISIASGTGFSGSIDSTNGSLNMYGTISVPNITVGNDSSLTVCTMASNQVISSNLTLLGAASTEKLGITDDNRPAKIEFDTCSGGGDPNTEYYFVGYDTAITGTTISGNLTLGSDTNIAAYYDVTLTGNISGNYNITPVWFGGRVIVNSSDNTSKAPNGSYQVPLRTKVLSDSVPAHSVVIGLLYHVYIDGVRGDVSISDGGILSGTGTVGNVTSTGGAIAPGDSPGTLNSGNVSLDSGSTLTEEIGGTAAGSYDQLNVTGTVSLGGATLNTSFVNSFTPALNDAFTIINNDGADAVTGTFAGLAQGATFSVDGTTFTINYAGGDGNDVVLTATTVPAPPDTAGILGEPTKVWLPVAVIVLAGGAFAVLQIRAKRRKAAAFSK